MKEHELHLSTAFQEASRAIDNLANALKELSFMPYIWKIHEYEKIIDGRPYYSRFSSPV